jgi:hypothetical protein
MVRQCCNIPSGNIYFIFNDFVGTWFEATEFHVHIERQKVQSQSPKSNTRAIATLLASFFVMDMKYGAFSFATMEFIQRSVSCFNLSDISCYVVDEVLVLIIIFSLMYQCDFKIQMHFNSHGIFYANLMLLNRKLKVK